MREQLLELIRTDLAFREEVRRLILTEELLTLPAKMEELVRVVRELLEAQRQHSEQIAALTEAQRRTEERIYDLTKAQQRMEERTHDLMQAQQQNAERIRELTDGLKELRQQVEALVIAQRRMEEALQWLINWQRVEVGRREGERYEREVIRRAPVLFNGGYGGSPEEPSVQQRLTALLPSAQRQRLLDDREGDPFLADLIWWKDEQVAVVEISLQVDGYDVVRADQRAATLREAGVIAIGVVIGREWANPDAQDAAAFRRVEWLIGSEISEGFQRFRQISA